MIKIVVIGESCIDKFIYCTSDRICPEAPVPVVVPKYSTSNTGMAGNTCRNLEALCPNGDVILYTQTQTITKTRYVEEKSNQMFIRVDDGEQEIDQFKINSEIEQNIKSADCVIVSDYNKGFLKDSDIKTIGKLSSLSILDSKRKLTNDIIKGFTFVKLNESERLNNPNLTTDNIITTLGKRGAGYKNILFESTKPQETIDVSGAGDTFTAAFITKFFETKCELTSIEFANKMACKVVGKRGVVTCI